VVATYSPEVQEAITGVSFSQEIEQVELTVILPSVWHAEKSIAAANGKVAQTGNNVRLRKDC
jgi:hypothetical protein